MFGSEILEVAIGLIFVFLLVSVMCSAIREGIESWLKTRAAYLERGIRELLHDVAGEPDGLARAFYQHPLIHSLHSAATYEPGSAKGLRVFANGRAYPSYIPARNFATALMDIAARGPETDEVSSHPASPPITTDSIRANLLNIQNPAVRRVLLNALDSSRGDLETMRKSIEAWYDSGMDRVSGWYKRSTQWILFGIGITVAVVMNVDTIGIARYLHHNEAARALIVAQAERAARDSTVPGASFAEARAQLDSLGLPIGWPAPQKSPPAQIAIGWFLTALAATFGAPFWFDLLNKVMVIRSTVKPHEKSPEESSEDRQKPREKVTVVGTGAVAQPNVVVADPAAGGTVATPPPAPLPRPEPTLSLVSPERPATPRDRESRVDACDVDMNVADDLTADEDLPAAEGGVA